MELNMKIGRLLGLALFALSLNSAPLTATANNADVLRLRADAPQQYVVKKGDTLWAIAEVFLDDPWLWPELWQINQDITNPHLIYPGDQLSLIWLDGKPQLTRKAQHVLLPEGTVAAKGEAIAWFPGEWLQPFMIDHRLMATAELQQLPQVMGDNSQAARINGMAPIYVSGKPALGSYRIYTPVSKVGDNTLLRYVAKTDLQVNYGELVEGTLSHLQREVKLGDVLLQGPDPVLPERINIRSGQPLTGYIAAALNDHSQQGLYDIVLLPYGSSHGVEIGQMYQAVRAGVEVFTGGDTPRPVNYYDPADDLSRFWRETTQLPAAVTAELLVLKVDAEVSYAMVVDAEEWLRVGDYFVPKYLNN
jgi:hypothetical protein